MKSLAQQKTLNPLNKALAQIRLHQHLIKYEQDYLKDKLKDYRAQNIENLNVSDFINYIQQYNQKLKIVEKFLALNNKQDNIEANQLVMIPITHNKNQELATLAIDYIHNLEPNKSLIDQIIEQNNNLEPNLPMLGDNKSYWGNLNSAVYTTVLLLIGNYLNLEIDIELGKVACFKYPIPYIAIPEDSQYGNLIAKKYIMLQGDYQYGGGTNISYQYDCSSALVRWFDIDVNDISTSNIIEDPTRYNFAEIANSCEQDFNQKVKPSTILVWCGHCALVAQTYTCDGKDFAITYQYARSIEKSILGGGKYIYDLDRLKTQLNQQETTLYCMSFISRDIDYYQNVEEVKECKVIELVDTFFANSRYDGYINIDALYCNICQNLDLE